MLLDRFENFEQRESVIDGMVKNLAERENMKTEDILSDIITFAPYEGNEATNPDYIEQVAEMMGISTEEMTAYAIKKAKDMMADIASEKNALETKYAELSKEIEAMKAKDQDMRDRANKNDGIIETEEDNMLDRVNTERMKAIVEEIGWPTVSKVGAEVAHAAWLLVQHADHDAPFQKKCLEIMRSEPKEEVDPTDTAFLYDRVCVHEGRPQYYGTQYFKEAGDTEYRLRPIEDEEHVDERRAALGMEPLAEYMKSYENKYKK